MKNKKYIFLILHYQNIEVTNSCINSLLNFINMHEIQIVIVDNGSPNTTGKLLREKWKENQYVDVLLNRKNEGFSRGNNYGFKYIKNNYNFEYLIVINNDIEIRDINFCLKIDKIYHDDYFDVLGPDVYKEKSGIHQNPERIVVDSLKDVEDTIKVEKRKYRFYFYYSLKMIINTRKLCVKQKKGKNRICCDCKEKKDNINDKIKLHGSCLIFSSRYIRENSYIFSPETFLYCEEDILALKCKKMGYKVLYDPSIQIIHLGSASSNLMTIKGRKKFYERRIRALDIVKNYIIEEFENG